MGDFHRERCKTDKWNHLEHRYSTSVFINAYFNYSWYFLMLRAQLFKASLA